MEDAVACSRGENLAAGHDSRFAGGGGFGFLVFEFRICLGFRISNFGFPVRLWRSVALESGREPRFRVDGNGESGVLQERNKFRST